MENLIAINFLLSGSGITLMALIVGADFMIMRANFKGILQEMILVLKSYDDDFQIIAPYPLVIGAV